MGTLFTRRQLLRATTATAVVAGLPSFARGQATRGLEVTSLGPDLVAIAGAGANAVALGTADGVLLVDGGLASHSAALLGVLEERWPGRPVRVLFNTNWRDEHVGANEAANTAGAMIMAHENTKLWLGGDFDVEWENRHYAPRPTTVWPNATFYTSGGLDFGGQRVEYWHVPRAHTDGDVAVFLPAVNVLVASDLLSVGRYPIPDYSTGGWIGGLQDAARKLLDATDAATRIVPAEGPVSGRAALEAQHELCAAVRRRTNDAFRAGMSFKDFVASQPTADFDARWGDPELFLALVYKGAFAHMRELGGVI